jgi:hypothetical protein
MVLATKEASYIIVLGIVISILPISSTLLQDGSHVRFKQNSNEKRRAVNQTLWISSTQKCAINLLSDGILDTISRSDTNPAIISEHTEAISEAIPNSNPEAISDHSHCRTQLPEGGLWQWLCKALGEHFSSRYVAEVDLSVSSHICSRKVLGRNVCNCSSAVHSVLDARDQ